MYSAIRVALVLCLFAGAIHAKDEIEVPEMKHGMQVVLTAQEGRGAELAEIMLKASQLVATLDGCEIYIVQVSTTNPDKILVTEVWTSPEAQQASLANPKVRELIGSARPLIAGMEHELTRTLGGKGL